MKQAPRYHHGNLRESLVEAGLELARTGGPDAVVLRAASREAGVSHNAAYRHFADHDQLLRAVCERCMRQLALLGEQRVAEVRYRDPVKRARARLRALGAAYIEFAITETGWFLTAFAVPLTVAPFGPDEGVGESGLGPYGLLSARLDELVVVGALPAQRRPGAETAAWSAVHGISTLITSGPLRALGDDERRAAIDIVLDVVDRGLRSP